MKKFLAIVVLAAVFAACEKEPTQPAGGADRATPPKAEKAEETSWPASGAEPRGPNPRFYEVAKKLDAGGDFYLYLDVKNDLARFIENLQPLLQGSNLPPQAAIVFPIIDSAIDSLGLYDIEAVGVSGSTAGDLYRTRAYLRAPGERKGLFKIFGPASHPFASLEYAPADTVLFGSTDLDLAGGLDVVREVLKGAGGEALLQLFNARLAQAGGRFGTPIEALVRSLGGEFALIAVLDPTEKVTIPASRRRRRGAAKIPHTLPAPRVALMIRAKDSTLYDVLADLLQKQAKVPVTDMSAGEVRKLAVQVPPNPAFPMNPTLAFDGQYVIVASHTQYLDRLLETKKAGGGLAGQEEFQRLTHGLPKQGNGLAFQSKALGKEIGRLWDWVISQAALEAAPSKDPTAALKLLKPPLGGMASVRVNEPEGIWVVTNRSLDETQGLLGGARGPTAVIATLGLAPAAIISAIAIPNFREAGTRSKVIRTKTDMRAIANALEAYAIDFNRYPDHATGEKGANAFLGPDAQAYSMPTFRSGVQGPGGMALTTPIAYMTRIPFDVFAPQDGTVFGYYSSGDRGWILFSPGPDGVYDIDPEQDYDASKRNPLPRLIQKIYNATNGTKSTGDILRVRQ